MDEDDADNQTLMEAAVDIIMCIDVTGSMEPLQKAVKKFATAFPRELDRIMEGVRKNIVDLRLRIIAFRDFFQDYKTDQYPTCEISDFFHIISGSKFDQAENDAFTHFVDQLECIGGGNEAYEDPESGLEALHLAFTSNWSDYKDICRKRRIVMLFTDSDPHDLNDPRRDQEEILHPPTGKMGYPDDCPRTLSDLYDEFEALGNGRRLWIYGPEGTPWHILSNWAHAILWPNNQNGLEGVSADDFFHIVQYSL